ncbi:AmmeMemoRadiSam system protein B [Carboxylicivirga taeanensis]|uniref:AmmeMemoRadiSam system protein B n=1 Tax=Carboxylicivirga taeanensis TaxID=1416875 RepID=UPI003F6DB0C4
MRRKAAVAGSFYPGEQSHLQKQVEELMLDATSEKVYDEVRALIVPHAGYVYSGSVAAAAYHQVAGNRYDSIFLLGTSHKLGFKGAAVPSYSAFETPLGSMQVNRTIVDSLAEEPSFFISDEVHEDEHTLEVQLPFIQNQVGCSNGIVPIIVGTKAEGLKSIAQALKPFFNASNLFIVSTDFSHYPPAQLAEQEDKRTADIICLNDYELLLRYLTLQKQKRLPQLLTGLCGGTAVLTMLATGQGHVLEFHQLLYQHSGMKLYKDEKKVVGYQAIAVCEKAQQGELSSKGQALLLIEAHQAIENYLAGKVKRLEQSPDVELVGSGVFVSVYVEGQLRGCVGQFTGDAPLTTLVKEQAVNAAFFDSRFPAVQSEELDGLKVEISILTPMRQIAEVSEINMGQHGIYIKKGSQHGTFLPQVGARNDWSVEEYLGHCSRDKAGIGWDGWRDAEVYVYEAIIISDKDD